MAASAQHQIGCRAVEGHASGVGHALAIHQQADDSVDAHRLSVLVQCLQKLHDFQTDGFVDLQKIVADYGIRDKSVKKMTAIILGFRISKTQQLSNWEAESLSEAQCRYAATDAWVCREMYLKLLNSEKNPLAPDVPAV